MSESRRLIAIVEGNGEVDAVPVLIRRISGDLYGTYDIDAPRPVRAKGGGHLIKAFENLLHYAMDRGCSAILVMVDTDTEYCPKEMAVSLADRARNLNMGIPVSVVCPNSEYETWFICTLSQDRGQELRDRLGIEASVVAPENVEEVRGAKGWLSRHMPGGRNYRPTSHQAALTHHIDIELVQSRSRSFRRLCHAVEELIDAMNKDLTTVTPSANEGGGTVTRSDAFGCS